MLQQTRPASLLLSDGTMFHGKAFGYPGTATGEICFNTGMTGYQEVFTDPSYFGQVLIMNNVHIGNYGVVPADVESNSVKIKALIARNLEEKYSRYQATASLEEYLHENKIVAIEHVDTRALVAHVRTQGAMNCVVSSEWHDYGTLRKILDQTPSMTGLELASQVSTTTAYEIPVPDAVYKVAVLDYGVKQHILTCMTTLGISLKVFPAKTSFREIRDFNADGYFISNGPGDPSAMPYAVETIKEMLTEKKPVFGICLGHQLLALANNVPTFKMHHGHRGLNHPVKNIQTGLCEMTTQNHGFGIDPVSAQNHPDIIVTHVNLNDDSIEGIRMRHQPAFSVQYHPESTPGPHDSRYLFNNFLEMIKIHKN